MQTCSLRLSVALAHVAAAGARRPDAGQIDRAVADIVIGVAAEILGREFPVARHQPFLDAAQHFGLALAAVPAVELQVEVAGEVAEIFDEARRGRIPGRPDRALVVVHLRDLDEAPFLLVEPRMVGLAEIRHADQPPVGAVAPAVIGAGEDGRRALVVAAHLHAAMAAGIEEDVDPAGAVAAQDHRLLAHRRHEIVAGLGDLAFMPDDAARRGRRCAPAPRRRCAR